RRALPPFPTRRSSDLLIDWFQLDKGDAGLRAAGFTVAATLARPIGGWLADKIGGARVLAGVFSAGPLGALALAWLAGAPNIAGRSEEHTSELQSPDHL